MENITQMNKKMNDQFKFVDSLEEKVDKIGVKAKSLQAQPELLDAKHSDQLQNEIEKTDKMVEAIDQQILKNQIQENLEKPRTTSEKNQLPEIEENDKED